MTTSTLQTLADYPSVSLRCCGCHRELPRTANAELFTSRNAVSDWLVIECPSCNRFTPHKLEKDYVPDLNA